MKFKMLGWRLILENICTKQELDNYYSLDDIYEANFVLDLKEKVHTMMMPKKPKGLDKNV